MCACVRFGRRGSVDDLRRRDAEQTRRVNASQLQFSSPFFGHTRLAREQRCPTSTVFAGAVPAPTNCIGVSQVLLPQEREAQVENARRAMQLLPATRARHQRAQSTSFGTDSFEH